MCATKRALGVCVHLLVCVSLLPKKKKKKGRGKERKIGRKIGTIISFGLFPPSASQHRKSHFSGLSVLATYIHFFFSLSLAGAVTGRSRTQQTEKLLCGKEKIWNVAPISAATLKRSEEASPPRRSLVTSRCAATCPCMFLLYTHHRKVHVRL